MEMIRETLECVERRLNEFFRTVHHINGKKEWVILSNLCDNDGSSHKDAKDKVVMFLANIQHETTISTFNRTRPLNGEQYGVTTPPLYINLFVLFFANFYNSNYREGLSAISTTISFFQQNPVFNHDNLPSLSPEIDKLTFEMTNLDLTELNYLMGLAGSKYLPSVFFKIRMLPFDSGAVVAEVPAVRGIKTPNDPKPLPTSPISANSGWKGIPQ